MVGVHCGICIGMELVGHLPSTTLHTPCLFAAVLAAFCWFVCGNIGANSVLVDFARFWEFTFDDDIFSVSGVHGACR